MKKLIVASAIALASFSPAVADGLGVGLVGGIGGVGVSFSGAGNLTSAFKSGQAQATADGASFGQAESAYGIGVGTLPNGSPAHGAYGGFLGSTVATGSMSQAATRVNGNGLAGAGSIGGSFAGTGLVGGAGLGIGINN